MILLGKREFDILNKNGLINHGANKNYTVINKQKSSKRKKYAVVYDWRCRKLHDAIKRLLEGKSIDSEENKGTQK